MGSLKIYSVSSQDHTQISLPNPEHLARRIMFSLWYEKESKDFIQYRFNSLPEAIKDLQYIRKYLKHRGMFLNKIEVLEKPDLMIESELKAFEESEEGVYQETENSGIIYFLNDIAVCPSD